MDSFAIRLTELGGGITEGNFTGLNQTYCSQYRDDTSTYYCTDYYVAVAFNHNGNFTSTYTRSSVDIYNADGTSVIMAANLVSGSKRTLTVSPASYNFGNQAVFTCGAPQEFTLSNTGTADINVTNLATNLTVSNNNIFEIIYDWGSKPCYQSNPTITPGGSCTVGVIFGPATSGLISDDLVIESNDINNQTLKIHLSGSGISNVSSGGISNETQVASPLHPLNNNIMTVKPSNFAAHYYYTNKNEFPANHNGVDLALSPGGQVTASFATKDQPVHSICDGDVEGAYLTGQIESFIKINHQNCNGHDVHAYYGHINPSVKSGRVVKDQPIGTIYNWIGNWHLHLTLDPYSKNRDLKSINHVICDAVIDGNTKYVTSISNCTGNIGRSKLSKKQLLAQLNSNQVYIELGYGKVTTYGYKDGTGKFFTNHLYITDDAMRQLGFISYFDIKDMSNVINPNPVVSGLDNGLVGHWKFDDPNNIGFDSSSYGNHGTPASGYVVYSADGRINGSASFIKGSNSGITVPYSSSLNFIGGITMAAWVKMAVNDGYGTILSKSDTSTNEPYALWASFWKNSNHMAALFGSTGTGTDDSGASVPAGVWNHLAVTYDGQPHGNVRFYVNGSLVASIQSNALSLTTNASNLHIGASPCPIPEDFYGLIDEVRLYNRFLGDSEINGIYMLN